MLFAALNLASLSKKRKLTSEGVIEESSVAQMGQFLAKNTVKSQKNLEKNAKIESILARDVSLNTGMKRVTRRIEPNPIEKLLIKNTFFSYCSSLKVGGAIFVSSDFSNVDLTRCVFNRCSTRDYQTFKERKGASGGAFLIQSKSISLSFLCVENCQSNGVGISFYSQTQAKERHTLNYSSMSLSHTSYGKDGFCMDGGILEISFLNSTRNKGIHSSAGATGAKPLPADGFLRYSHFSENSGYSIFTFQQEILKKKGNSHCNFVNNTLDTKNDVGILCLSPELVLSKFVFISNKGTPIFSVGSVFLINCCTDAESFGENVVDDLSFVNHKEATQEKIKFMNVC